MNDERGLGDKLNDLVKEVGGLTTGENQSISMLAKETCKNRKRLTKNVNGLQESLDYLRLCIKYQLFDLEATRRENMYLRKLLEEHG